MSNLLWNRVLLGSGLLGFMIASGSPAATAKVQGAEAIAVTSSELDHTVSAEAIIPVELEEVAAAVVPDHPAVPSELDAQPAALSPLPEAPDADLDGDQGTPALPALSALIQSQASEVQASEIQASEIQASEVQASEIQASEVPLESAVDSAVDNIDVPQDATDVQLTVQPAPAVVVATEPTAPVVADPVQALSTSPVLAQVPPDQNPVTGVDDLSDVQPGVFYYEPLINLINKYQCVAGYPDGTFRPRRSISRAEMAVLLNNCLSRVAINQEDIDTIKQLQEEFAAELAALRGRTDGLEARVATVEAQQFSTTTRLAGEAIFGFGGLAGDNAITDTEIDDSRISFNQRTRLNFLTSFSGKDLLYTRLQSSNRPINFGGAAGTLDTRIAFDTGDTGGEFILDRLDYRFPIGDNFTVTAFANAAFHHYYATTINPYFEGFGGGKGAISFFGERNPIYRIGTVGIPGVAGIGTSYIVNKKKDLRLDVGYLAGLANEATATILPNGEDQGGLVDGTFSLLGQLSFRPTERSQLGVTYVRNNAPDGNLHTGIGSANSIFPFVDAAGVAQGFTSDSVGLEGTFTLTDGFAVGGWFGYTFANQGSGSHQQC